MARIRTIKPEFWTDEKLTECSLSARLLFIGTWNFADDSGNLDRSPKQIKARVFPLDDIDCEPLLIELLAQGLLIEYTVNDKLFLHINGFNKHQLINRPSKPTCPPIDDKAIIIKYSVSTHDGREGKGREGKGKEGSKPLAPAKADAKKPETELQAACKATWKKYCDAYFNRYGTEPIRNVGVNSMVKQFVQKIGFDDSPFVAEFFVLHNDRYYVQKTHPVSLMSKDAEGLRTQWATGRSMTATRAGQIDQSQANFSVVGEAMRILEAQNAKNIA